MENQNAVVVPPSSTPAAEPSIADLRKMFDGSETETPAAEPAVAAPKPESSVTPLAEKTGEGKSETAAESDPAQQPEPKTEKPAESAIDKRFSKLAKQRDEARQQAEDLRRELEALKAQPGPAESAAELKPIEKPMPPDADTWTGTWAELEKAKLEYSEKLADWKVEQALAKRDQAEQQRRQEAEQKVLHGKWEERLQTAMASDPDFMDAVQTVGPVVTRMGVAELIKQSEVGTQLVQKLNANDQAELRRIAALTSPLAIAREIGKLESQLTAPPVLQPKPVSPPLPKPPAAVDGGSAPAPIDLDKCDQRTFNREVKRLLGEA